MLEEDQFGIGNGGRDDEFSIAQAEFEMLLICI